MAKQMQWDLREHQQIAHVKSPRIINRRKRRSLRTMPSRLWREVRATIKYTNTKWSARVNKIECNDWGIVQRWSHGHGIHLWYRLISRQGFRCNYWWPNGRANIWEKTAMRNLWKTRRWKMAHCKYVNWLRWLMMMVLPALKPTPLTQANV